MKTLYGRILCYLLAKKKQLSNLGEHLFEFGTNLFIYIFVYVRKRYFIIRKAYVLIEERFIRCYTCIHFFSTHLLPFINTFKRCLKKNTLRQHWLTKISRMPINLSVSRSMYTFYDSLTIVAMHMIRPCVYYHLIIVTKTCQLYKNKM